MAKLIWTEPALQDLEGIANYIALDKPSAAACLVEKIFRSIERLSKYPLCGKRVRELPKTPYREIVVSPCRIFYRTEKDIVYILHVMRGERLFRNFLLEERDRERNKPQSND